MKSYKIITAALLAGFLLIGLSACEKDSGEKAGAAIDKAASDVVNATEDATEAAKEKME